MRSSRGTINNRRTVRTSPLTWRFPRSGAVVLATFIINALVVGTIGISGLYLQYFINVLEHSKAEVAAALGLQSSVHLLAGLGVGPLIVRLGSMKVAACGAVLTSAGLLLTSFTDSLLWLYFFYTTMAGIGFGMTHIAYCTSVQEHTARFRALAAGFSLCGSGFGYFIVPQIARWSIDEYGGRGSFFILAGVMLHALPCTLLFQQPNIRVHKHKTTRDCVTGKNATESSGFVPNATVTVQQPDENPSETKIEKAKRYILPDGGFTVAMALAISSYVCLASGYYPIYVYTPTKAYSLGIDLEGSTMLISLQGVAGIAGRIVAVSVGSFYQYAPILLYISGFIMAGVACVLVGVCTNYWQILTSLLFNGLGTGMANCMHTTTIRDLVGVEHFALVYGYASFGAGIVGIGTTQFIAYMWHMASDLSIPFTVSGVILTMAALLAFVALVNDVKRRRSL